MDVIAIADIEHTIEHTIENHTILGNTAIVAEQQGELGYWRSELARVTEADLHQTVGRLKSELARLLASGRMHCAARVGAQLDHWRGQLSQAGHSY